MKRSCSLQLRSLASRFQSRPFFPLVQQRGFSAKQSTNSVLMVPPTTHSAFNEETAQDNAFMHNDKSVSPATIFSEWEALKTALIAHGVNVVTPNLYKKDADTPDCLFPNNWISTFNKTLVIYPMKVPSRRLEVRDDIIEQLRNEFYNLDSSASVSVHDLRECGISRSSFLEGTGVIVADHLNKTAYLSLSKRCCALAALHWSNLFDYDYVLFESLLHDKPIYHTNVMMCLGSTFAVVAMDCIKGEASRRAVRTRVEASGRELIEISGEQVESFCGNVIELELDPKTGQKGIIMSERAYAGFTTEQIAKFEKDHGLTIVKVDVNHIENVMGGGVRCMIAELF